MRQAVIDNVHASFAAKNPGRRRSLVTLGVNNLATPAKNRFEASTPPKQSGDRSNPPAPLRVNSGARLQCQLPPYPMP